MKYLLPLAAALALAACTNDPEGSPDTVVEDAAAPLPTAEEVDAIEAAATKAAADVSEANADDKLDALEAALEAAEDN